MKHSKRKFSEIFSMKKHQHLTTITTSIYSFYNYWNQLCDSWIVEQEGNVPGVLISSTEYTTVILLLIIGTLIGFRLLVFQSDPSQFFSQWKQIQLLRMMSSFQSPRHPHCSSFGLVDSCQNSIPQSTAGQRSDFYNQKWNFWKFSQLKI